MTAMRAGAAPPTRGESGISALARHGGASSRDANLEVRRDSRVDPRAAPPEHRDLEPSEPVRRVGDEPVEAEHRRAPQPVDAHPWTNGAALLSTGARVLLWLAIACGPIAVIATVLAPPAAGDAQAVAPASTSAPAAEALAVTFVGAWLSATTEQPEPYTTLLPGAVVEATRATPYRDLVVAKVTAADSAGVVGVVVGGLVDEAAPDSLDAPTSGSDDGEGEATPLWVPRYFQVAVATAEGVAVLAEPAAVAPPPAGPAAVDTLVPLDRASEAAVSVELFLSAFLTSSPDLERFVAPDATVTPLAGAPYVAVALRTIESQQPADESPAAGDALVVRATVSAGDRAEVAHTLTYWLALVARDGRWEVSTILPGPPAPPTDTTD